MSRRLGLAAAIAMAACSSPADSRQEPRQSPLVRVSSPASGHWAHYRVDRPGGTVDVYLAHDATPKPVLILIHGSGCTPVMTADPDGTLRDTTLFQDLVRPRLDRLHFAIVEKRGVLPQRNNVHALQRAETECSAEYVQNVTKHGRVDDVAATVVALSRQPWAREIILAGHSEGTHVTTGVLRTLKDATIAAAGLFASAGPVPFFGGYIARGAGDREESTPIEDVRDSVVPLFVAQGTRDGTTIPADLFTLEAVRQQPTRPIRYVVVDQGGHAFDTPGGTSRLSELFDDFVTWSLDANRQTSLHLLK